ncbi:putative leucine-rich repeat-containing protein DDB_G0290503 [Argopecten irradians]|uniref:putative leucine-rich repeat-containing protein DDB_G0290503 n=1 Tax=Argopecten irradians TaxID=31199 RepID=UPI00371680C0
MFLPVIASFIFISVSLISAGINGELSSPPNPSEGNGNVELQHVLSQLQELQSKFDVQQQENSQLQTTINQLLSNLNQLQTTALQLQTNVGQLQAVVASQNATISTLENQSTSSMQTKLDALESSQNASFRNLQTSFANIQDRVTELDDVNMELRSTLSKSQDIQHEAMTIQGNVTDFLCEHFTHSNISVTGNVTAGTAVIRGRDWTYGDQDGHDHVRGVVMDKHTPPGLKYVHWDNGLENIYRVGYAGGFDLYYYYPDVLGKFRHVICPN